MEKESPAGQGGAQIESQSQIVASSGAEQRQSKLVHPAANLLPPLSREEYRGLVASIRERGLLEDIEVYAGPNPDYVGPPLEHVGKILNGVHRQRACQEVGVEPRYRNVFTTDPVGHVLARNVHRHLDNKRKRQFIDTLLRADHTKSDRQIAALTGVSHPTVATVRAELERTGEIPAVTVTVGADGIAQRRWKNLPPSEKGEPPADEEASHDETPGDNEPEEPDDAADVEEPEAPETPEGVLVDNLNGPAAEAGIMAGDVITAVNGIAVKDVPDLAISMTLGSRAKLTVWRKGEEKTFSLQRDATVQLRQSLQAALASSPEDDADEVEEPDETDETDEADEVEEPSLRSTQLVLALKEKLLPDEHSAYEEFAADVTKRVWAPRLSLDERATILAIRVRQLLGRKPATVVAAANGEVDERLREAKHALERQCLALESQVERTHGRKCQA